MNFIAPKLPNPVDLVANMSLGDLKGMRVVFINMPLREKLYENFDIKFDKFSRPVCDDAFKDYVLELDDATKLLHGKDGEPLNFSAMSDAEFTQAREYADSEKIENILGM